MWYTGFIVGIASGAHCLVMCGPLHMAIAGRQKIGNRYFLGRVLFNLGRVCTYALLGLAVGIMGEVGSWAVPKQTIAIAAGVCMILIALFPTLLGKITFHPTAHITRLKNRFLKTLKRSSLWSQALTGVINGLLPCGTVYLALAGSLAMPTPLASMGFMAAFGLGTFPVLLTLAFGNMGLNIWLRKVPYLQPALAVSVAAFFIFRGVFPSENEQGPSCHTPLPHSTTLICTKK